MSLFKKGKYWHFDFIYRGKRHQGSTGQTNINKAKLAEAKLRSDAALQALGIAPPKLAPVFKDFIEGSFLEYIWRNAKKRRTAIFYAEKAKRLLDYSPLRDARLTDITADLIGKYCDFRSRTVGITTLNCELRTLRRALNLAYDEFKLIPAKIKVRTLPGERKREFIVGADLERQYLAAATYPLREAAILILDCGLRPEEAVSLCKSDISTDGIRIREGKTLNATRILPHTSRTASTCEVLFALFPDSPYLFPGRKGKHYGRKSLDNAHIKLRERLILLCVGSTPDTEVAVASGGVVLIGVSTPTDWTDFVLYSFRHTFATRLAESGADPYQIAALLGHADIRMSGRYVHPQRQGLSLAMARKEALDKIMRGEVHEEAPEKSRTS